LNILRENFHDNRFTRLITQMLNAGYLENWNFNATFSGTPQGNIASPILSNIVLDCLDKYVEEQLIPNYTRGLKRKINPPYNKLAVQASKARKTGEWEYVHELKEQIQSMPTYDPNDPNFRRLWYVRYADD